MPRTVLRAAAAALAMLLASVSADVARAEYPDKIIRIINPFPPGVSTDVLARGLAQKLTEYLGQSVIVESRPGANGILASTTVAKSEPDGYTMLLTTGSHVANPIVQKHVQYDPVKDFAPVTLLAQSYGLALVSNLPARTTADIVALARQKPGALTYATSGVGNLTHVAGRLFEARAGITMTAVPYNTPALMSDVIGGTVSMTFVSTVTAVPLVKAGTVKAFAITGARRTPALPDTPTMQEEGFKDYELLGWFGVLFPAGTPKDRVERMHREIARALQTPELKKLIEDSGLYVDGAGPDAFTTFLKNDFAHQDRLMGELGLKAQ
ncbi:tripartite tricarboxylate transporter substrate binding protein [Rhodoplanes sp. TEM]|uniref:Tripartite tricarboxylate transporter substrate binding protein n=1 Tax=Rhodoplanes tepidamans TaxID=200616 RepID=A0ABT5JH27_RHOTP|nr:MULTISPECIES: tripartite tricarboxylate transporter substrate binding protein [Rhodoplanes]MDC7788345.1 tripartite tricarboxylate transporter substrate binding protein [Rhodoplanes tepidamans]MDC7986087.1 tripartite tricarboxylate transporter substrate binding protein [Rhodoplanes sp. TEM]MDQ0358826.1 tripartite-type tricarboxylate transporter receptor subunit TctC [Rhodoplanes tepidamans]